MNSVPLIRLRLWEEAEAARVAELFNHPALTRNLLSSLPNPYGEEHGLAFIRASREASAAGMERAIELGGVAVGTVGARFCGETAVIGYWLGVSYWGRGIMSAALPRFMESLPPHISRLQAGAFAFNKASQALLLKNGFTRLPGSIYARSYDMNVYEGFNFERRR